MLTIIIIKLQEASLYQLLVVENEPELRAASSSSRMPLRRGDSGTFSRDQGEKDNEETSQRRESSPDEEQPLAKFSHSTTTTFRIHNAPYFANEKFIMSRPTQQNVVVAMVSMGPRRSWLVHRAVRSIRASGQFDGYIMVLTDKGGSEYFTNTLPANDTKLIVMHGNDYDLNFRHPPLNNTDTGRPYKNVEMVYKRFKTLLLQYVDEQPILNAQMEYIFYIDIDNVVLQNLQEFLNDYYDEFPQKYAALLEAETQRIAKDFPKTTAQPHLSFVSYWKENGTGMGVWQSGQTMYHRRYSRGCVDRWRYQFESNNNYGAQYDQPLLVKALKSQYAKTFGNGHDDESATPFCHIVELPQVEKHWDLARAEILQNQDSLPHLPTMLHFTKLRVENNTPQDQINICMKGLQLKYLEMANGTNVMVVSQEDESPYMIPANYTPILWEDIIQPRDTKGGNGQKAEVRSLATTNKAVTAPKSHI
jgi:hypothetical protein